MQEKQSLAKYILPVWVIAIFWFLLTNVTALMLAGLEDSDSKGSTVECFFNVVWVIIGFPMRYLGQWDRGQLPTGYSENTFVHMVNGEMLINGLIWGIVLVLSYQWATRFYQIRKHRIELRIKR